MRRCNNCDILSNGNIITVDGCLFAGIYSKNSRKEVLYGKYTKGKGFMYITLSELIQIGIFLVGFAALLKRRK